MPTPAPNTGFPFRSTAGLLSEFWGRQRPGRCFCGALVACGWFGIQSWIGGWAIYKILAIANPSWEQVAPIPWLGINYPQLGCFLAFWSINMLVIYLGIDSIRLLLNIKAPLLILLGLALLGWAYHQANGFGPMLSQPSQFAPEGQESR